MLGPDHPDMAQTLSDLARLYADQGSYAEAEPLYQLALDIREQALGPTHPSLVEVLEDYASLLRKLRCEAEAEEMVARAQSIQQAVRR